MVLLVGFVRRRTVMIFEVVTKTHSQLGLCKSNIRSAVNRSVFTPERRRVLL